TCALPIWPACGDDHDNEDESRLSEVAAFEVVHRGVRAKLECHEHQEHHGPKAEDCFHFAEQMPQACVSRLYPGQMLEIGRRERVYHRQRENDGSHDFGRARNDQFSHSSSRPLKSLVILPPRAINCCWRCSKALRRQRTGGRGHPAIKRTAVSTKNRGLRDRSGCGATMKLSTSRSDGVSSCARGRSRRWFVPSVPRYQALP